jgi:hypothetical protein
MVEMAQVVAHLVVHLVLHQLVVVVEVPLNQVKEEALVVVV